MPTWALVAAMAACVLGVLVILKLAPHPVRVRVGAAVAEAPGNALVVRANVPSADVFADERLIGKTPLEIENTFPFGRPVTLSVRAVGFEPIDVEVMGGRGTHVDVTFAPPESEE